MKRALIRLLVALGAMRLVLAARRGVRIVMIHGVMSDRPGQAWRPLRGQLPPAELDAVLRRFRRYFRFVTLDEAAAIVRGELPLEGHPLVVTFDDGYRNNLTEALPVLRRHRVPATFFVATGHVDGRRPFWFDRVDYALQQLPPGRHQIELDGRPLEIDASDRAALECWYREFRTASKRADRSDREMQAEMDALAQAAEAISGRSLSDLFESDPWSAVMNWDDLRTAAAAGIEIGSHTVDHIRLGYVGAGLIRQQVTDSRARIEQELGRPCRHFCYPNGDASPEAGRILAECGYLTAVTTHPGVNAAGRDPMFLDRINLPIGVDPAEALAEIGGLTPLLAELKRRLLGRGSSDRVAAEASG